jgi:mannosyl-3-phosphoglycerate phosphatase
VRVVVFADVEEGWLTTPVPRSATAELADRLAREQIAVVFCSSRTRAELEALRQDYSVYHPFICENGGGVFIPEGYFPFEIPYARRLAGYHAIELGRPYTDIVDLLRRTAARLGVAVVGFSDMSVEQVAAECRMPLLRARLAKLREYSEVFRIVNDTPSARRRLRKALQAAHLACQIETPYSHVGSPVDADPGIGLLTSMYRRARGQVVAVDHRAPKRDVRATGAGNWSEWIDGVVELGRDARGVKPSAVIS